VTLPPLYKRKTLAIVAIGIVIAATVAILWLWNPDAERKAILNVPQSERRAHQSLPFVVDRAPNFTKS
jgi:hypothetical protein